MFFFESKLRKNNRELIYKTITDVNFRRALKSSPTRALKISEVTEKNKREINKILSTTEKIQSQINALADELLCSGGGCGIAR